MMNLENKKQLATLALAIGLGFVAVFLTGEFLKSSINAERQKLANDYKKSQAALAQEMEKRMSFLKQEMDKQKQEFEQKIKDQQKSVKLSKDGTPVADDKGVVSMAAFSVKTPPGKRALTIMIDSLSAVGGLINPGDFVDVIAQLKIPTDPKFIVEGAEGGKNQEKKKVLPTTTVLFQNVQILAVDTNFNPLGEQAPNYSALQKARTINVTLAVSPEEATLLTFAQTNGKLQLMLRSPAEQDKLKMGVASWDSLAEFLLQNQGTEIAVPKDAAPVRLIQEIDNNGDEVTPFIEIFKSGKQSK